MLEKVKLSVRLDKFGCTSYHTHEFWGIPSVGDVFYLDDDWSNKCRVLYIIHYDKIPEVSAEYVTEGLVPA